MLFSQVMSAEFEQDKRIFNNYLKAGKLDEAKAYLKEKSPGLSKKRWLRFGLKLANGYIEKGDLVNGVDCLTLIPYKTRKTKKLTQKYGLIVADEYIKKRDFKKALEYYQLVQNKPMINRVAQVLEGNRLYQKRDYELAILKYRQSGFSNLEDKILSCYQAHGLRFLQLKQYDKVTDYFKDTGKAELIAWGYKRIADDYRDNGYFEKAKVFYRYAISAYEKLLKDFNFNWKAQHNVDRLHSIIALDKLPKTEAEKTDITYLESLLYGVGKYCRLLRKESIFYYCNESVKETIDNSFYGDYVENHRKTGLSTNTYIYSYQMIYQNRKIQEKRDLIRVLGKTDRKMKKKQWNTQTVLFQEIIFSPVGLLGPGWQQYNDCKIVGEEIINGRKLLVIECIPKYPLKDNEQSFVFGRAWVDPEDYSILKTEWEPKALTRIRTTNSPFKNMRLSFVVEYGLKRGDIRYPTRAVYVEKQLDKKGGLNTCLSLDIRYDAHRFFKVGTETKFK